MPTVLILAASPHDQDRLRLNAEVRDIRQALQRSRNREEWKIESNEAVTVDDLRRALLDCRPTVVHFCGHGGGDAGLCFEDADGNTKLIDAVPLTKLFHHFKEELKCVFLNACYSDVQGKVIQQEVDYVIGMNAAVGDKSAIKFAVAFYDAVFAGTDFRVAFDLGCSALDLSQLPDTDVPVFMTGSHLSSTVLSYSAHVPEIERVLYSYFNMPFFERASFTTTGESLRPAIKTYYGDRMHRNVNKVSVISIKPITDEHWCVEVSGAELRVIYVCIRNRSVFVEWEASVGLWSIPIRTYLALGTREPVVARIKAKLDTYYNLDFASQKNRFQSISLETGGPSFESLHGYVKRDSKEYDDLMEILSDGNEHAITLELIQVIDQTDMPLINKVLSRTWIYSQPKENCV